MRPVRIEKACIEDIEGVLEIELDSGGQESLECVPVDNGNGPF